MRIDCTKIAGQILDSSERHCKICLSRSSRFWHIALIVILKVFDTDSDMKVHVLHYAS